MRSEIGRSSTFAVLLGRTALCRFLLWCDGRDGGIARRRLALRTQRRHVANDGFNLVRRKIVSIGGHVAAALNDLANELIPGHTTADVRKIRSALPPHSIDRMTIAALHSLQNDKSLKFKRGTPLDEGWIC